MLAVCRSCEGALRHAEASHLRHVPVVPDTVGSMDMGIVVGVVVGLLAGVALGWVIAGARATGARAALEARLAAAEATAASLRERDVEHRGGEQQQARVLQALTPLQEHLRMLQQRLSQMERQREQQYGTLSEQLAQTQDSEQKLRGLTASLEGALRNASVRGSWGEAQLRNVVESAGLVEHVDFDVQRTVTTDDGRLRPDMVVHLPGGKSLPVDAKTPLDAYIQASQIPLGATGAEGERRRRLLARHVRALRDHVDALASKHYWTALPTSPDFVVAFLPSESLLSAALQADPTVLQYAFDKRVALASPVTLWSVLKTVAYAWQQDALTEQAKELFDLSRELYERLGTLAGHAERLRGAIQSTVEGYNRFAASLESRVLVTARRLQRLDEGVVLSAPASVDTAPRALTAPELTGRDS